MVQREAELRVADACDQGQSADELCRGLAEAGDLPVIALVVVVVDGAIGYRHIRSESSSGTVVVRAEDTVRRNAIQRLEQPVDVRVVEVFDGEFLRELSEDAGSPLDARVGIVGLQPELLGPGAL